MPPTTLADIRRALAQRLPRLIDDRAATQAAVSLILREVNPGLELLFIHRAEHPDDPWSGQMAFPGGRAEPGDDDLVLTALRETLEEIGVDLGTAAEHLGRLDEVQAMARGRSLDMTISPFVFRLRHTVPMVPNEEVGSIVWLPLDELLGEAWRSTLERSYEGVVLELPCIRAEGRVIWGLTFRMFENLEELLRRSD